MKTDIRGSRIPYHKLGAFPYFVGYCDSASAWNKEMKRINVVNNSFDLPLGASTHAFHDCGGYHLSIVVMNRAHYRKRGMPETVNSLSHEATHVVQNFMRRIGEKWPSEEFQAYMTGEVTQWLFEQYKQSPPVGDDA